MKVTLRTLCLFCLALLSFPSRSYAQLYTLQTRDMKVIYYDRGHAYLVQHLARCFENALRFHKSLFGYIPTEPVTILLQDFGDYGNGGATGVPNNLMSIGISPFHYTYETVPAVERMSWMMNHELVHILTMDKAASSDKFYRSLFSGKVAPIPDVPLSMLYSYLTSPRLYAPRWFFEGIAVFMETWMNGGLGRALGAYDEMVFRTMVRDSSYFYDVVGLESEGIKVDFQVGASSYLYGTRFMTYLALQYGPEKLLQWHNRTKDSKAYFASEFLNVFGASLDDEWTRWIAWEHQWQQANLDSIRVYLTTPYRLVSQNALGSVSRAFYDSTARKLYCAINYPGQIAHIAAINVESGSIEKVTDVRGGALFYVSSLAFDPSTGNLFYTTDNNKWRDLNVVNIRTGTTRMLIKDVRTGDLAFNQADKSLWGIRHYDGISTLVRIPPPYAEWNQVYSAPYGKDMFDIDISPDGSTLISSLAEIDGSQRLIKMDIAKLLKGETSHEALFDFENSAPANFVFSGDGKFLFGSSYRSGVSNVVRYDVKTKNMEWISNCETGFFRPVPLSTDSLIVFSYTGKGFVPVVIANKVVTDVSAIKYLGEDVVEKRPIVTRWHLAPPSPSSINIDTTFSGEYSPFKNTRLTSGYPVVEGYKEFAAYGLRLNFSDLIMWSTLDLTASYAPNRNLPPKERLHAALNFHYSQWNLKATYNAASFYDLFGPTKTSRKGYSVTLQYKDFLVFDEPETMDYFFSISRFGGLERLPEFQNVTTSFDKFLSVNGRLNYHYTLKSLGAVEDEKGIEWQLLSYNNYVNAKVFSRVLMNFDYGILLPINHSSIWLRSSFGYSFGERREPLANFYFGGFGNNWVDHQEARRYREFYSFPGVELNAIGGTNYGKLLLEWTLPPLRFRRFGFSTLYCNWMQLVLFSSGMVTNIDGDHERRSLIDLGAQLDFRLVIFSTLESTLSLGYVVAFEKERPTDKKDHWTNEFMVSLKLLK